MYMQYPISVLLHATHHGGYSSWHLTPHSSLISNATHTLANRRGAQVPRHYTRPPQCTLVTCVYCFVSPTPAQSRTWTIPSQLSTSHCHPHTYITSGSPSAGPAFVDARRGVVYSTEAGCIAHSIRRAMCSRKDDVWGGIRRRSRRKESVCSWGQGR
ncbi:hypothetical protein BDQ17DRAFT_1375954 [Cyathus striatus]|nr:hypothetical protein BDQ17DRAFT_1375954 [Cyathus striatus]